MYICHNEDRYWGQYRKFGAFSQRKSCIAHMHTHNKIVIIINTKKPNNEIHRIFGTL